MKGTEISVRWIPRHLVGPNEVFPDMKGTEMEHGPDRLFRRRINRATRPGARNRRDKRSLQESVAVGTAIAYRSPRESVDEFLEALVRPSAALIGRPSGNAALVPQICVNPKKLKRLRFPEPISLPDLE